jgi:hypothetical protein
MERLTTSASSIIFRDLNDAARQTIPMLWKEAPFISLFQIQFPVSSKDVHLWMPIDVL